MSRPRFAWPSLRRGASPDEIVRALNQRLPQLAPAIEDVARAAVQQVVRYLAMRPEIVAFTDTTVTVRATGRAPVDPASAEGPCAPSEGPALAAIQVALLAVENTSVVSGAPIGEKRPNQSEWTFARPAGTAPGWATFEATLEGSPPAQADQDQIAIPQQGVEIVVGSGPLVSLVPVASDEFTVTVDATVRWQGDGAPAEVFLSVVSFVGLDAADFTPATVTGPPPLVRRFTISRPLFQAGVGRALIEGGLAGGVVDRDAIDVPEIQQDTIPLVGRVERVASTDDTITLDVIARDPRDELVPDLAVESFQGVAAPTLLSSTVAGFTRTSRYLVQRPALGTGQGRVNWLATAAGRVADPLSATITERGTQAQTLKITARPVGGGTATSYPVVIDAADPLGGAAASYEVYAIDGIFAAITGSGTVADPYRIPRPPYGSGTGRVTFRAFKSGRTENFDAVEVPEQQRDTITPRFNLRRAFTFADRVEVWGELFDRDGNAIAADSFDIIEGVAFLHPSYPGRLGTAASPWVLSRGSFNSGGRRFTVRANKAGYLSPTDSENIEPQERDTVAPTVAMQIIQVLDPNRYRVQITIDDPRRETTPAFGTEFGPISAYGMDPDRPPVTVSDTSPSTGRRVIVVDLSPAPASATGGQLAYLLAAASHPSGGWNVQTFTLPAWRPTGRYPLAITNVDIYPENPLQINVAWYGYPIAQIPAGAVYELVWRFIREGVTLTPPGGSPLVRSVEEAGIIATPENYESVGVPLSYYITADNPGNGRPNIMLYFEVRAYYQGTIVAAANTTRNWYWTNSL